LPTNNTNLSKKQALLFLIEPAKKMKKSNF